ncbi:hypothetical protein ARHIZOSPH14_18660 [Agromyces rhizosphaerae]|uniref:Uncharacterized protein n=1 Tax=Agromyces rhizosphaerae TaxID=88374 RepID=A0A9W6CYI5_9MICO|nr:hypothetical protein [Agromyces rhizosphaerae]GLI27624.1 hypothetical protein ARHIZOSPH14_18660 [Agromyces rhizosphaerae]
MEDTTTEDSQQQPKSEPAAKAAPADQAASRPGAGHVVATLLLLALFLVATGTVSLGGVFLPSFTEDCITEAACDRVVIGWGSLLAIFGPWLVALVVVIWTTVRMLRRRAARRLPILGIFVNLALFAVGLWLAASGVG